MKLKAIEFHLVRTVFKAIKHISKHSYKNFIIWTFVVIVALILISIINTVLYFISWNCYFPLVVSALSKETTIICEYESRTIGCPDDQVLEIVNCNYGRTSVRPCAWGSHQVTNCTLPSAIDTARAHCNGQNTCELTAKSGVWKANPCIGVIKYVEVKYICNEVGPSGKLLIYFVRLFCLSNRTFRRFGSRWDFAMPLVIGSHLFSKQ